MFYCMFYFTCDRSLTVTVWRLGVIQLVTTSVRTVSACTSVLSTSVVSL